jgi:hypothetical protein
MLAYISDLDGWTVLKVVGILLPVLIFVWIVATVISLHRRDVYFWSLGSTWTSIVACPAAIAIASMGSFSQLHDPNAPLFHAPLIAGAALYAAAFAYAAFYNYRATGSSVLTLSTSMLQQFAVLGVIFLFLRWQGHEVNRRHR